MGGKQKFIALRVVVLSQFKTLCVQVGLEEGIMKKIIEASSII